MKEIKPDQRWSEGVNEVQVTNAFGVRIRIRRSGAQADEEITEGAVRNAVGIRCGAFSGNMKVSFQAARSIG